MPKRVRPKSVKAIKALPDGRHAIGHVAGLCVDKSGPAWNFGLRYSRGGVQHWLGLGPSSEVTLAEACEAALAARKLSRAGIDPIEDKRQRRQELLIAARRSISFTAAARQYITAHGIGWKNPKHRQQWSNTIRDYAEDVLGALPVDRIETAHILNVLEPIWHTKTETASRVRQRIEAVLDYCTARGYRSGDNPARWNGHLENLLPPPAKVTKVKHFAALPWRDMPTFMERLRSAGGMGARALEFAILTAARSGEVRGATWGEVDLDHALWTIPGDRMKTGKAHAVPLSSAALKLLRELPRFEDVPYLFPSPRSTALSDMTLTAVLRRMELPVTVHGMRSAFRDWCAESTAYSREVAEMSLAHAIGDAVEAAYRRGDLMAKRTRLMRDWAVFLASPKATLASVTTIQKQRAK